MTSHLTLKFTINTNPTLAHSIITRNDAIKLIFVKLFSVLRNARCDTEVEKKYFFYFGVISESL
jgi:hypothetical protein